MHRRDFGTWGIELPEGEFAQALAALGVLPPSEPLGVDPTSLRVSLLRSHVVANGAPLRWALPAAPRDLEALESPRSAAPLLARAWRTSRLRDQVSVEIDRFSPLAAGSDPASALPWIAAELSHPDVRARSVYVRVDEPAVDIGWQWPLRVGLLGGDPGSHALGDRLRALLDGERRLAPLVKLVDVAQAGRECDLLLLPMDLRAALSAVTALGTPPRADCTVVLGRAQGRADQWYRLLMELRAAAETSGVVLARVAPHVEERWFSALIRELSDNRPLDAALFTAARSCEQRPPFITAARKLVDFSRLSRESRERLTRSMPTPMRDTVEVEPDRGSYSLEALSERPPRREGEPASGPRYIQAKVFDLSDRTAPVQRRRALRAGAPHEVVVRIGLPGADWESAPRDRPFPFEKLPQEEDRHELTVVFSEPRLLAAPQRARIVLPRRGDSTEARFFLSVPDGVERIEGRILVVHRNRVLQTALLLAPIAAGADDADGKIEVEPEVIVRAGLDDLRLRQPFAAALVLNHDTAGVSGITAVADDEVARFTPSSAMRDELDTLDRLLTQVAREPKDYMGEISSEANVDLLRRFAQHGSLLYDHIVRDGGLAEAGLAGNGPLQVVSAVADARLPIELVYAREAPAKGAPLCPDAVESLRRGTCGASCPQGEHEAICPLAFWGIARVIERHAHSPRLAKIAQGQDFAVRAEPSEQRRSLDVLRGGIVAGSQRVEKAVAGGLKEICQRIAGEARLDPITTWDDWAAKIAATSPSLLVLVVHTEPSPDDDTIPQMEIGTASWLTVFELGERHIRKAGGEPPLVLLLGCETGVPEKQFANFINRLRNRGAAIVVATGAKIHSLHAVPVAEEFIDVLREAVRRESATFGEVMREVRRHMLARGFPMALTLTAYGDADWRLVQHP